MFTRVQNRKGETLGILPTFGGLSAAASRQALLYQLRHKRLPFHLEKKARKVLRDGTDAEINAVALRTSNYHVARRNVTL